MKSLTIRDIARLSGVSRSTVSLVLNHSSRISDVTRQHVWRIIQEVGYEPNALARGLARKRSGMVAVVVPATGSHVFSDFYFSEAISGIGDVLAARRLHLVIEVATPTWITQGAGLRLFGERRIDGMLLLGTLTTDAFVTRLVRSGHPCVLVNTLLPHAAAVAAENAEGAKAMVLHLAGIGHERIAFIGGLENTTVGLERTEGYRAGIAEAGLSYKPSYVVYGNFSEESGATAMRALLTRRPRPTAVFAANDMMAIGALAVLHEEGLRVPEDIALAGADDTMLASYVTPPLTTIRQSMYAIGRLATEMLLERIANPSGRAIATRVETELVIRASCGAQVSTPSVFSRSERRNLGRMS
jgi:DNA-binding LacI/PurR family transcriptional regulator